MLLKKWLNRRKTRKFDKDKVISLIESVTGSSVIDDYYFELTDSQYKMLYSNKKFIEIVRNRTKEGLKRTFYNLNVMDSYRCLLMGSLECNNNERILMYKLR